MSDYQYTYLSKTRSNLPLEQLSYGQLGHMVHTLLDSSHRLLVLENEKPLPDDKHNISAAAEIEKLPPDFVTNVASDWRAASTFFINTARETLEDQPTHPTSVEKTRGVTDITNTIHGLKRAKAAEIAGHVKWPEHIQTLIDEYKAAVKIYRQLTKEHGSYAGIPKHGMETFSGDFHHCLDKLKTALIGLDVVTLEVDGKQYPIQNKGVQLADSLEASSPAALLFFLGDVSKAGADPNRRPGAGWSIMKTIAGARSSITDTMDAFQRHLEEQVGEKAEFMKVGGAAEKIKSVVADQSHNMQLLHQALGMLGDMYPQAQQDIARFLEFVDEKPEVKELQTPKEAAFLLYTAAKALKLHGNANQEFVEKVEGAAKRLAEHESFAEIKNMQELVDIVSEINASATEPKTRHAMRSAMELVANAMSLELPNQSAHMDQATPKKAAGDNRQM